MDGRKRIARLRNAEKWKAMGFGVPVPKEVRVAAEARRKANLNVIKVVRPNKGPRLIAEVCSCELCNKPKSPVNKEGLVKVQARYGDPIWVPKNPLSGALSYGAWLERKGWTKLGSGAHSTVFGRDNSDKVIKVTRTLDNWIDYVQWAAKEGYAGNLAPRVYSWKRRENWSVAVVEKMERGGYNADHKDDGALLMSLTYPARKGSVLAQCFMEDITPGSVKFFDQLHKLKYDGDVGGNNFMFRKDGSLCLTDPCAGSIKTTLKRLRSGELSPTLW